MADVNAELVTSAGLDATPHPASPEGDTVPPDVVIRVSNSGGSPITLTIETPGTVDGDLQIQDRAVTVPASEARYVRAPRRPYQDPASGRVNLSWSDTAGVTFEVIR